MDFQGSSFNYIPFSPTEERLLEYNEQESHYLLQDLYVQAIPQTNQTRIPGVGTRHQYLKVVR